MGVGVGEPSGMENPRLVGGMVDIHLQRIPLIHCLGQTEEKGLDEADGLHGWKLCM